MNTDTVVQWLQVAGVPAGVVSIGVEVDNAWCLLRCDPADGPTGEPLHPAHEPLHPTGEPADGGASLSGTDDDTGVGESAPEWEVFWREQGNRYDWARFSNEQVACYYLFGRLAWTQVASGALRHAEPPRAATG